MVGLIGNRYCVLLGDWNAHHYTWSLDGNLGPGGRVLADWVQEVGGKIHFWEGGTCERQWDGQVVQSRLDFIVASQKCSWAGEDAEWLVLDYARIDRLLVIVEVMKVDSREVIY